MEEHMSLMIDQFRIEEYRALRAEMDLRITIQNNLLLFSQIVTLISCTVQVAFDSDAHLVALFACSVIGASALMWCHHGVRQAQLKPYLIKIEDALAGGGWERWLPANRPQSLLGTRWFVSTKGVFIGLQIILWFTAFSLQLRPPVQLAALTALVIVATAGFLLTNLKERVPEQAAHPSGARSKE